jgi:hypothetical protein
VANDRVAARVHLSLETGGKRPVFAVLAVGDLAWPAFWGPGQNVPGDRGLIFRIDVRTARVSSLGGTRASLGKLGPSRRLT